MLQGNRDNQRPQRRLDERKLLWIQRKCLENMGFWPENAYGYDWKTGYAIFHVIFIICVLYGEGKWAAMHVKHALPVALDSMCPCLTKFVCIMKCINVAIRRKEIAAIIRVFRQKWRKETREDCINIYKKHSKLAMLFGVILLTFGHATSGCYFIRPMLVNLYYYLTEQPLKRILPFKASDPFVVEGPLPAFLLSYFLLGFSGLVTVFSFVGIDGLFIGLCLHISAEFKVIKWEIDNITKDVYENTKNVSVFTKMDNEMIARRLAEVIHRHDVTTRLCHSLGRILAPSIFSHFVSSSLIMCITLLLSKLDLGITDTIVYCNYTISASMQIFAYAVGGSYIMSTSSDVAVSAYTFDWYKCNRKTAHIVMLIIMRAQKTSCIEVPFFVASIQTFGAIVRTSASYFTLLQTFL